MNYQNLILITPKNQTQRKAIIELLKDWEGVKLNDVNGVYISIKPIKDVGTKKRNRA